MTQSIAEALARYCESPPEDLVAHFARSDFPQVPELSINFLPLTRAVEYTSGIQEHVILGEPFGLIALEDANNSNPYCYITKGPTRGSVMYLCHDGDSYIAFATLAHLLSAVERAIRSDTDIEDLNPDLELMGIDRSQITRHVEHLLATDGLVEEICVLIRLIPTSENELTTTLSSHEDFYVREAVAMQISASPNRALLNVARNLSTDPHPQVARPGKQALSAVNRLIHNR